MKRKNICEKFGRALCAFDWHRWTMKVTRQPNGRLRYQHRCERCGQFGAHVESRF